MIKEINDLSQILESDADLFFFDVEDTLLASNIFYDLIGYKEYCEIFLNLCKDVKVFDVTYLGKNFKRILMQQNIPQILNELKRKKKKIFALTSGYPSHQKKTRIRELGLKIDGFLFTRGKEKGPFLSKFLILNNLSGKCAFIDNHYEKIKSVEESFKINDPTKSNDFIDLFLYKREFIHTITKQDFVDYWAEVITEVKGGAIDQIKAKLQKSLIRKKMIKEDK